VSLSKEQEIFNSILKARGLSEAKSRDDFLNPDYHTLHDPFLLPDIHQAVDRIKVAKDNGELVYIYGDYDVDGLTATALLLDALSSFGIETASYIPNRFTQGYGMSVEGIRAIARSGAKLIITVDCGSKSLEEVELANKLGLDVIITDHHTLGDKLPEAISVINPKRADSKYPFNDLAGVGVAFKLVCALQQKLDGLPDGQEKWLLDLVAMGTTCDVVSLTGENRPIAYWGIEVARQAKRPALRALSKVSSTELNDIDTTIFGFRFGPRLNAVGRLETAQAGLELLSSTDTQTADKLAKKLDELNSKRRQIQSVIYDGAVQMAVNSNDDVLVLANKGWSHGVVGIVASRIVEEFAKPTFIIEIIDADAKGSARSFGDFNLAQALNAVSKYIIKGGGHAMAAGVSLETQKIDKFRQAINRYYREQKLGDQSHYGIVHEDLVLESFAGLNENLIELLKKLEPYGEGNRKPIFKITTAQVVDYRRVGADKKHLKLTLSDADGISLDAIGFNLAKALSEDTEELDAYFNLELNTFRDETKVQLNLLQISPLDGKKS